MAILSANTHQYGDSIYAPSSAVSGLGLAVLEGSGPPQYWTRTLTYMVHPTIAHRTQAETGAAERWRDYAHAAFDGFRAGLGLGRRRLTTPEQRIEAALRRAGVS
jgi:hypothetical protein